jgi:hypothetical protein
MICLKVVGENFNPTGSWSKSGKSQLLLKGVVCGTVGESIPVGSWLSQVLKNMVWLTAGVPMWESGLALRNGFRVRCGGRDHGDETKTRNASNISTANVEKARRCLSVVVAVVTL